MEVDDLSKSVYMMEVDDPPEEAVHLEPMDARFSK